MPHSKGLVKVLIKASPNKSALDYYRNNYMMEIQASFNMGKYLSVNSTEAIEAVVGKTKSLTFMILPGKEQEVSLEIGTDDFEMSNISFAMIPVEGDILDLVQDFVEDKNSLRKAWDSTNKSLDVILNELTKTSNSVDKIIDGSDNLKIGLNELNGNSNDLKAQIEEAKNDFDALSGDFSNISNKLSFIIYDLSYLKNRANTAKKSLENLKVDFKELIEDLDQNQKDIARIAGRAKGMDEDIDDIENLLLSLEESISGLNKLLSNMDVASGVDFNTISKGLGAIQKNTEQIAKEAGIRLQTSGNDPEFYMEVINSAQNIGTNLQGVAKELQEAEKLISSTNVDTNSLSNSLRKVQKDLDYVAKDVDKFEDYATDVPNGLKNANFTIDSVKNIVEDAIKELDDYLEEDNKNINSAINNVSNLLNAIQGMDINLKSVNNTFNKTLTIFQEDIDILSNKVHESVNQTINGTQNLLNNLKSIAGQSQNLKKAKNDIYNVITSDLDDIENETTIFKINPDSPVVSFASSKNRSPEKVQIFVQTEAIKECNQSQITDLEPKNESKTFWEKLVEVFQKIIDFIKNLFK